MNELVIENSDSSKIDLYYKISKSYHRVNLDSLVSYTNKLNQLSNKINYERGFAFHEHLRGLIAFNNESYDLAITYYKNAIDLLFHSNDIANTALIYKDLGISYYYKSDYPEALSNYSKSIYRYKLLNDSKGISNNYNNIGIIFKILGEYDSSYTYYFRSSELKNKVNDQRGLALNYNNIANLKISLKNYEEALPFLNNSLKINNQIGYKRGLGFNYENLGVIKYNQGFFTEAQYYYNQAIKIYTEFGMQSNISDILKYKGQLEYKLKNFEESLLSFNESLEIKNKIGNKLGMAQVLILTAKSLKDGGDLQKAIKYANKSLKIAASIGAKLEAKEASEYLHEIYHSQSNSILAYKFLLINNQYKDSLYREQRAFETARIESKYALSKVNIENEFLQKEQIFNEQELIQSKLKIKNQYTILLALIICLIFALLTVVFWYIYTQKKHKTINQLQELNMEISHQKQKIELQSNQLKITNSELETFNHSLEDMVLKRTEKIATQNKKLREYAFANSHEVRAPLANLLGLINITLSGRLDENETILVNEKIEYSSLELKKVVSRVNLLLKDDHS